MLKELDPESRIERIAGVQKTAHGYVRLLPDV